MAQSGSNSSNNFSEVHKKTVAPGKTEDFHSRTEESSSTSHQTTQEGGSKTTWRKVMTVQSKSEKTVKTQQTTEKRLAIKNTTSGENNLESDTTAAKVNDNSKKVLEDPKLTDSGEMSEKGGLGDDTNPAASSSKSKKSNQGCCPEKKCALM